MYKKILCMYELAVFGGGWGGGGGVRPPDAPVLDPPLIPYATPKYLMLESALAYLPRQATNGVPNTAVFVIQSTSLF